MRADLLSSSEELLEEIRKARCALTKAKTRPFEAIAKLCGARAGPVR